MRRPLAGLAALVAAFLVLSVGILAGNALARSDDGPGGQQHHHDPNTVAPTCTLTVPPNPTSAAGLTTPYTLAPGCDEANPGQAAFVEAAIADPSGAVSIYHPVVVNQGSTPAAPPAPVRVPAGSTVAVWFGFNGDTLGLVGPGAPGCVAGLGHQSPFGQFGDCNAAAFFRAAKPTLPALGTARDGQPCPTVRDFSVVDQDQSDNVFTAYRVVNGRIAQTTAATANTGTGLTNGSDNRLLDAFIDPALGCAAATAPDQTNGDAPVTSLAMNELQAAAQQRQPAALVPMNDPMVLDRGRFSPAKTALYRVGVDQPRVGGESPQQYCADLVTIGQPRLAMDANLEANAPSPTAGQNLRDFLAARFSASLTNLKCPAGR